MYTDEVDRFEFESVETFLLSELGWLAAGDTSELLHLTVKRRRVG